MVQPVPEQIKQMLDLILRLQLSLDKLFLQLVKNKLMLSASPPTISS